MKDGTNSETICKRIYVASDVQSSWWNNGEIKVQSKSCRKQEIDRRRQKFLQQPTAHKTLTLTETLYKKTDCFKDLDTDPGRDKSKYKE